MENELCPGAELGSESVVDPGSFVDISKRRFLEAAGMLMAGLIVPGGVPRGLEKLHRVRATRSWW